MSYTIKALFLAFVMFLALDAIKTAHENQSKMPSTYKAFAELTCGDIVVSSIINNNYLTKGILCLKVYRIGK